MNAFTAWFETAPLSVALDVGIGRVSAASLEWRGGQAVVAAHASEPLPDGALIPSLTAPNTHDRTAVVGAIGRVLERVGRPRRIGLIIPDVVARVSLVRFAQVPTRTTDLDQLVRWQVRKAAPFPIGDAQISYVPGLHASDGQEFVVSLARRDIIQEYEGLCAEAGAHAGLVDLATFSVINAVLAGKGAPGADWLLIHVAPDYASIALLRGPHMMSFRNRANDADGTLADLVHQTAMYYEDRLKGDGLSRVILAGAADARHAGDIDQVRRSLQDRLTTPVDTIDPRTAVMLADRIAAPASLLDALAPLVGLLLRECEAVQT
jgi:Tfp pilus assembly PilM family ATPase